MLRPQTRHLLTDALKPPAGCTLDLAVATTYSLDLNSLLLAPLAMAAHDAARTVGDAEPDPIALLESVKRHAERMTVFCHAGAIHVPASYRRLLAFAEGSVVQVLPTSRSHVFHPKVWVMRFMAEDGRRRHRFLCLSRNLTPDRSWDTVLRLDEVEDLTSGGPVTTHLSTFLTDLPKLAISTLSQSRSDDVHSLAKSVAEAQFALPSPFHSAEFWPLGTATGRPWPFPDRCVRFIAITPFLDAGFLRRAPAPRDPGTLISRPETFDRVGGAAVPPQLAPWTLQRAAETTNQDSDATELGTAAGPVFDCTTGLHAKTFVWETGEGAFVLTGSANGTMAAFNGNVEFSVLLRGTVGQAGVEALLGSDRRDGVGLSEIIEPYTIPTSDPQTDPVHAAELAIERIHAELVESGIYLTASPEGDAWALEATTPFVALHPGGATTLRPLGRATGALPVSGELVWHGMAEQNLSPFVVAETTLSAGGATVTRNCVLKGMLSGDPKDRHKTILRELLSSEREILRYLALLLGDPAFDDLIAGIADEDAADPLAKHKERHTPYTQDDLIVFEPLVRAVARRDGSLARVDELLKDLAEEDGTIKHLSEDFRKLWRIAWTAAKELES